MDYASVFVAVQDTYARLAEAIDGADADAYIRVFSDDCVVEFATGQQVVGRDALFGARLAQPPRSTVRHYVTNHIVEVSDEGSAVQARALVAIVDVPGRSVADNATWRSTFSFPDGHALITWHQIRLEGR